MWIAERQKLYLIICEKQAEIKSGIHTSHRNWIHLFIYFVADFQRNKDRQYKHEDENWARFCLYIKGLDKQLSLSQMDSNFPDLFLPLDNFHYGNNTNA